MYRRLSAGPSYCLAFAALSFSLCCSLVAQDPARREALARAAQGGGSPPPAPAAAAAQSPPPGPGQFRLVDLSLDLMLAAGGSTERDAVLGDLQGGGHDPRKRGFTLQQAELSLAGAVDPYFTGEAHLVTFLDPITSETVVELEEAYATSMALPYDLQVKAGLYLTEFGRLNATHPHAWDWQDQPVILTRVFGPDGMRAPGARVSWLAPTANFTELTAGLQNANGEQMSSFLANEEFYGERPIGGRAFAASDVRALGDLVWTVRAVTAFDLSDASSVAVGASAAFGPNATGEGADTAIYGVDFVYKWRPPGGERGSAFFKLQGELLAREFDAVAQVDTTVPGAPVALPARTLRDRGGYLQALWGFAPGWDCGLRGEWAGGSGDSFDSGTQQFGRDADMFRADRWRASPLVQFHPSEFARLRLQYNYDDTDALADPAHSVWLGFEVLIGTHPAHKY